MLINGKCHCGNISFSLHWLGGASDISARACGCTFCIKHGAAWTSKPGATLNVRVHDRAASSKYAFGTQTATFHLCSRCGAVPFVSSKIANRLYAVVNVNTFEGFDLTLLHRVDSHFKAEDIESRLSRRVRNWIDNVHIDEDQGNDAVDRSGSRVFMHDTAMGLERDVDDTTGAADQRTSSPDGGDVSGIR